MKWLFVSGRACTAACAHHRRQPSMSIRHDRFSMIIACFRQFADFSVGQAETRALGLVHINGFLRRRSSLIAVDHLDGLAAQVAAQDGRATRFEVPCVRKFIEVDRTLYGGFTQAVGFAGDKHRAEADSVSR